jgi:hypothetical protein
MKKITPRIIIRNRTPDTLGSMNRKSSAPPIKKRWGHIFTELPPRALWI